jgi:hypothetical protein
MTPLDFKELKRICILTHIEVMHLKNLLIKKEVINEDGISEFSDSIEEYVKALDLKTRALIQVFPDL